MTNRIGQLPQGVGHFKPALVIKTRLLLLVHQYLSHPLAWCCFVQLLWPIAHPVADRL